MMKMMCEFKFSGKREISQMSGLQEILAEGDARKNSPPGRPLSKKNQGLLTKSE